MSNEDQSIFLDKISLSSLVIDKKGQMIGLYNDLILSYRLNEIRKNELEKDSYVLAVIRTIKDLYDMMKYKKIPELIKKHKSTKEKEVSIKELLDKFMSLDSKINIEEINTAYENLLYFISLAGYDSDETKKESQDSDELDHW